MKQLLRKHIIFYIGWIIAIVLPSGAGYIAVSQLHARGTHNPLVLEDNIAIIWLFCISTFLVAQPLLLRYVIRDAGWWLVATLTGGLFGLFVLLFPIDLFVAGPIDRPSENLLFHFFLGLGTGVFQWFVLRRSIQQASLWIVLSVVSIVYTVRFSDVLGANIFQEPYDMLRPMLVGAVYGALSGVGLLWLLLTRRDATLVVPENPIYEDTAAIIHSFLLLLLIMFLVAAMLGV
jgi:hypothetical protein